MNRNLSFRDAMDILKFYNEILVHYMFKHRTCSHNDNFINTYIEINDKIIAYCERLYPRMRDQHSQRKLLKFKEYLKEQNELYKKIKLYT